MSLLHPESGKETLALPFNFLQSFKFQTVEEAVARNKRLFGKLAQDTLDEEERKRKAEQSKFARAAFSTLGGMAGERERQGYFAQKRQADERSRFLDLVAPDMERLQQDDQVKQSGQERERSRFLDLAEPDMASLGQSNKEGQERERARFLDLVSPEMENLAQAQLQFGANKQQEDAEIDRIMEERGLSKYDMATRGRITAELRRTGLVPENLRETSPLRIMEALEQEVKYVGRPITEKLLEASRVVSPTPLGPPVSPYLAERIPGVGPLIERVREEIEPVAQTIGENVLVPSNLLPGIGFGDEIVKAVRPGVRAGARAGREFLERPAVREAVLRGEAGEGPVPGMGQPPREPPVPPVIKEPPLEPERLPSMREVEARSKPLPPEVRAELAGPAPETRFPIEDWTAVEQRWGNRYQENWWTTAEDAFGSARPSVARSPLEKSVRNTMITRDLYVGTQSSMARTGMQDWIGRARPVLGLDPNGIARNVPVAPSATIPEGLAGRLDHIVEHPEKYILDAEQTSQIQGMRDILTDVVRAEQRHRVDVQEIVNGYFPRLFTKLPDRAARGAGLNLPRVTPGHARQRAFTDIEEAWTWAQANGAKMADPFTAMDARLVSGVEAIANRSSVDRIRQLGFKPSERVSETLAEDLRAAREEFKTARVLASKKNVSATAKIRFAEAETGLNNLKRAMRVEGRRVAQMQPRLFGRVMAPEVVTEFSRYIQNVPEGAFDDVLRVARVGMVNADHGALFLQGYSLFWENPQAWVKASGLSTASLVREPYGYIAKNPESIARGIKVGAITPPTEFLLSEGGKLAQKVRGLPIIKQSQRVFEWFNFIAQAERWKAIETLAKNPDDLLELSALARSQGGSMLTPGLTVAQAKALSRTWFAPRFMGAMAQQLTAPIIRSGAARTRALRVWGQMFGGAIALTVGANYALTGKLPNLDDPNKAGYLGIRVGDAFVYPMGPFQPMIVALARTGNAVAALAPGKQLNTRDLQAWPRFVEAKLNIGPRIVVQAMEAMGVPLEGIRGRPFDRPTLETPGDWKRWLTDYLPIGPSQAIEGIRKGAPITALEILGGRTSVVSPATMRNELSQQRFGADYFDLDVGERQQIDADPKVQALSGRIDVGQRTRGDKAQLAEDKATAGAAPLLAEQAKNDAAFQRGDMDVEAWKDAYGETQKTIADKRKSVYDTMGVTFDEKDIAKLPPQRAALERYFQVELTVDPVTREPDWDTFFADRDTALTGLSAADRRVVQAEIEKNLTPLGKQFRAASTLVREYYDKPKWLGVSLERQEGIQKVHDLVERLNQQMARQGIPDMPSEEMYLMVGRQIGNIGLAMRAYDLRPGSSSEESLRNPASERFLLANRQRLEMFYPNLFRRESLQVQIGRQERSLAGIGG